MSRNRVMVVDDHELIRKGLRIILEDIDEVEIVAEVTTGTDACRMALLVKPDVIFMDISLPDRSGIDACREITRENPGIRVIALSQHEEQEYIIRMMEAGAIGYMFKNSSREEFVTAIKKAMAGERYFCQSLSDRMFREMTARPTTGASIQEPPVFLTRRETEIIRFIASDRSNQEISEMLHISLRTVETHRRNIMQKLKLKSVVALTKYALAHHLVTLGEK